MTIFSNPTQKQIAGGFFRAGEKIAAGGTLSQAALAALNDPPQPDGLPGEPPIVDTGVRRENLWDDEMKNAAFILTFAVVGFVVLYGIAGASR